MDDQQKFDEMFAILRRIRKGQDKLMAMHDRIQAKQERLLKTYYNLPEEPRQNN